MVMHYISTLDYMYLLYCIYREDECNVDVIPKMVAKNVKLIVAVPMFYIGNRNQIYQGNIIAQWTQ